MQGGIRRGLHIDDDDEPAKYEYGGFEAGRKRDNFEKDLDDMLFGGGPRPKRRAPASADKKEEKKEEKKPEAPKTTATPAPASVVSGKPAEPAKLIEASRPTGGANKSVEVNRSGNSQPKTETAKPSGALNTKKEPSILKPVGTVEQPGPSTLGIVSKPVIKQNNYVAPPAPTPSAPVSPPAFTEETITIESLHGFSKKNQHNKPGLLRKGKKVAENFKFAEQNITLHSAVDVVRPYETDRARQKKLNQENYQDFEFPARSSCLGAAEKDKESTWKKPNEVSKIVNFGKYIDPNDFNVGTLSSPQFLSALSGIAEQQANTKRLIEDQTVNSNGFYLIRLFVNSVWRYVPVDNLLPFLNGVNAGVLSSQGDLDLQGPLIEKAYAKCFGGYDVFSKSTPRQNYIRDLTGAPVKKIAVDHLDVKNVLSKALGSGQVVQAVPTEKIATLGINPLYSYSVTNSTNKGIELRNSWGTLEEKSKANIRGDGTFDLSQGQIKDNLSHYLVSNINSQYYTTTVQAKHRRGFYSTYSFRVRNQTQGFFTVSQWDERFFPASSGYGYSPATIILQRNSEKGAELVASGHTINARNLDLQVDLAPGSYTIFVAVSWKGEEHTFNFTFYGSERADLSRVYTEKEPNLIAQSLESYNVSFGKRTDPSKTTGQYWSYHRESNCVLITVENTSNRQGRSSIDLSKAKLEKLNLISGHNNEDNYSEKVSQQIDDYKQAPLADKRWGVQLEAGHRFTWVLAVTEPYDESNPRLWGLN